jgi:hypothetical protein
MPPSLILLVASTLVAEPGQDGLFFQQAHSGPSMI